MRLPAIFTSIQITISVFVIVIAYYTISNVTDKVIQRLSDDLLNQSSKVAQQIFDEQSTSAFYSLQALLLTREFIGAIENNNQLEVKESLLNIYDSGKHQIPYDILFVHGVKDEFLVDASKIPIDDSLIDVLTLMPATKLNNFNSALNYIKYQDFNLLVMKIEIPGTEYFLYGLIQISAKDSLLQSIKQQTNSQCVMVYYKDELLATVGTPANCHHYIGNDSQEENYFQYVKDGFGLVRRKISNQDALSSLDVVMVIPLDSILAFQQNLERFLFVVLIIVLFAALAIQFIFSKFISRSLSNIIQFTQNKNQVSADVPRTGIMEFDKIAAVNHKAMVTLQNEIKAREATELKLHESNKELIEKSKQANIANEEKSRFLANISHEIRTPMNAIINLARFTLKTELTKRQHYYIDTIYQSCQTLLRLVNDVLDLSKIEANQLDIENAPFNLEKVLADVRDTVGSKLANKQVEFKFDIDLNLPAVLNGDSLRLYQVLTNLCDNAVKFTEKGSVTLRVVQQKRENDTAYIEFSVIDTGIGIDVSKRQSIFENFTQANASIARKYGGTGLGLSIVTKLVELMGGQINLSSEVGAGSCFSFVLNLKVESTIKEKLNSQMLSLNEQYIYISNSENTAISDLLKQLNANIVCCHSVDNLNQYLFHSKQIGAVFLEWKNNAERFSVEDVLAVHEKYKRVADKLIWVRDIVTDHSINFELPESIHICINPPTFSELLSLLQLVESADEKIIQSIHDERYYHGISDLSGKQILVAEDNIVNQEIIVTLLKDVGVTPQLASSGIEVLNKVNEHGYDLILMDVRMPEMNGIEATTIIREKYDSATLPVIGLSAYAMKSDIKKCIDAGMNDYLDKPIEPSVLYEMLNKFLNKNLNPNQNKLPLFNQNESCVDSRELPNLDGLDVKQGVNRVAGNADIYIRLLHSFTAAHEKDAELIENAIADKNYEQALELLHSLKGASSTISANTLYESICHVEKACLSGDAQHILEQQKEFTQHLNIVLNSISQLS